MQEFCGSTLQDQGHTLYQHPVFFLVANTAYMDFVAVLAVMHQIWEKRKISPVVRISDRQEQVRWYLLPN